MKYSIKTINTMILTFLVSTRHSIVVGVPAVRTFSKESLLLIETSILISKQW